MTKERRGGGRRWRKGSEFGPGLRAPMNKEQRKVWHVRVETAYGLGRLTSKETRCAHALADRLGRDGQLDPSHATIAAAARASVRTVIRAFEKLRDLGMLRWVNRLVRAADQTRQGSNSYQLMIAERAVSLVPKQVCQRVRGIPNKILSLVPPAPLPDIMAARAALDRVRRAREREMTEEWLRRRGGGLDAIASMQKAHSTVGICSVEMQKPLTN